MNLDGRLRLIGWTGSVLFHGALLLFGAYLLVRTPTFTVTEGKTSTEIEFAVSQPEPQPVAPPTPPVPAPAPPVIQPPPPNAPVAVPDAFSVPTPPKVVPLPQMPTSAPAVQHPPARFLSHPAPKATAAESSSAAKGAIKAVPDDLRNDPPEYPDDSRAAHEQGIVMLRVEVSESGTALSVHIMKSSGYFRLDQAARRAVEHWKFHPGMAAELPVPSEADVPVRFTLQQ
jgi:protein TonB